MSGDVWRYVTRGGVVIKVNQDLRIPENEIDYVFSPSSKPGGQKVNKASTRVTLVFDVTGSASLSDEQRRRIRHRLGTRISKDGLLRVVSQKHRSQHANREAAKERLGDLLREALKRRRRRKKTKMPAEAREQRLRAKKHRGTLKQSRAAVSDADE
jgi:ribosome-associated protein